MATTPAAPSTTATTDALIRLTSAVTIPKAVPMIGTPRGATIMAPMTVAVAVRQNPGRGYHRGQKQKDREPPALGAALTDIENSSSTLSPQGHHKPNPTKFSGTGLMPGKVAPG